MSAKADRQTPEEDEIDLGAIFTLLWASKYRIGAFVLAGVVAATVYLFSTPRIHEADALLQLEEKSSGLEGMGALFAQEPKSLAEVEIFRSRRILGTVVDELDLTLVAVPRALPILFELPVRVDLAPPRWRVLEPFDWNDAGIDVGIFEVPEVHLGEEFVIRNNADGTYLLRTPEGVELTGGTGQILADEASGLRLRIDRLIGPAGREFRVTRTSRLSAIQALRESLSISELGRGTEILRVTFRDPDPDRAGRILASLTEAYVAQNISRNSAEAAQSLDFVNSQLPAARARVDAAQAALNDYRQSRNSVDFSFETAGILNRITELRASLSELDLREQEVRQRFRENHPVYQRLMASREELERQLTMVEGETESLPETQKEILNLSRDLEVAQEIYAQLVNNAQQLQLARASAIGNVRILDRAAIMPDAVAPRSSLVLALAMLLGAMTGIGWALSSHFFRRKVGSIDDVEELGLSVYGILGRVPAASNLRPKRGQSMPLMKDIAGTEQQQEALRSLRTSLHFGLMEKTPPAIMITSAAPGDGKSFTAANLASVSAMADQKVCLVDADLRRGYLERYFGVPRSPGLSEYLAGDAKLEDVVRRVYPDHPLYLLPSGRYPPNPSELIMSPKFQRMIDNLGETFDLTLYDAPPVLAVTDATIIARSVPLSLAVVRHAVTDLGAMRAMKRVFERSGQSFSGVILNDYRAGKAPAHANEYHYAYSYAQRAE